MHQHVKKPLVEGLVLKSFPGTSLPGCREAPRGGAGIEISTSDPVESLQGSPSWRGWYCHEAPRGGAGIEIIHECMTRSSNSEAPRGGAGIEIP